MKNITILLFASFILFSNSKLCGQELTLCQIHGQDPINNSLINSKSSQFLTNTLSNQVIYLQGTFTVNTPQFTFSNCIIKMASGAKIFIDPTRKLTITNCKIFSCTDMWKEITVSAGAKLQLQDSEIEDGQYAVHSGTNAPIFNIINNRFNRNHVSIFMSTKIIAQTAFSYSIYGNDFDCTSSLNSPYPTQSPAPAQTSFAGIWLQGVPAINIGQNGAGLNEFVNQMIGILSERSYVVVTASTFKNILSNGVYEGYDTGIGISALNNSYLLENGLGNQASSPSTFDHCERMAVFSSSSIIRCFFNRMVNIGGYGILTTNAQTKYAEISSNLFEVNGAGTVNIIGLERGAFGADLISSNDMYSNFGLFGGAVNVHALVNSTGTCRIYYNHLFLDNVEIGLDLHPNSSNNLDVEGNTIYSTNGFWPAVIYVASGNNTRFGANHIFGNNTTWDGAYAYSAKNTTICGNVFDGPERGLVIGGNSMGTDLYRNTFKNYRAGLRLEGQEIGLGDEKHHENMWAGTCQPNIVAAASHTGTDPQLSAFYVNPNNDPNKCGNPVFWPNCSGTSSVIPSSGWFTSEQGDTCASLCVSIALNSPPSNFEPVDMAVMDGSLGSFGYSEAGIWEAKRYLYKKLQDNTLLQPVGSQAYYFVQSLSNSPIGAFYLLEKNITDALSPNNELQNSISTNHGLIESLMSELTLVREGLLLAPSDAQLLQENDQVLASLLSIKAGNDDLMAQFDSIKTGALTNALSQNENIVTQNVFEANQKTINNKRIRILKGEALTNKDWETIRSIANQCYLEGGPAVYSARELLPSVEQIPLMKNEPICSNQNLFQAPSGSKPASSGTWLFYPNPAHGDKLYFSSSLTDFSDTRIEIIDAWGKNCRLIAEGQLDGPSLDISGLASGIYWVKVSTSGQPASFHKFVNIQRP